MMLKSKIKDQQGKGNVHRTQPPPTPTPKQGAPGRHKPKQVVDTMTAKGEGHVMCEITKNKTGLYGNQRDIKLV
jgi:hypothetical protein